MKRNEPLFYSIEEEQTSWNVKFKKKKKGLEKQMYPFLKAINI